ncbi:hypothetical protein FACS1894139_10840 [Planctomycetales bacterium]|nr:hypothetical protein FACS1894107_10200 [Planctomycetales bacterium]GHS99117.1 hypothetical protein FACS1894108_08490 [Planctomycetales bacterium]GHT05990.1 hypothetical protein FACS1894139_10840 [Planctomycetales bacterium]GHV20620.1 hypothetical protein AGMMS49959_08370 [Planctomycetales bacterium]
MSGFYDPILAEVRRRKEQLCTMYGGIEGLHRHMDEERPLLEKQGWKFADADELTALQTANKKPVWAG